MRFLRYEKDSFLLFLGMGVIFLVLWLSYGGPSEMLIYSYVLGSVLFLLLEIKRFYRFYESDKELQKAIKDAQSCLRVLPKSTTAIEERYQELMVKLQDTSIEQQASAEEKQLNMDRYYSMWSHQIKTPIAGIHLLLQEDELDSSAVNRELHRIEQYVDTILWYQRLNRGGNDFVLKEVDVEEVVKATLKQNVALLMRPGIKIELKLQPYHATTDAKWLGFVVEQLLSNAVKYTPNGTVAVRMEETPEKVFVHIQDTGIGIRPEDLPRIFEWGYTGINGHDNKKSTGIGLALCKEAMDRLGHQLLIDSKLGVGTTVTIGLAKRGVDTRD